MTTEDSRFRIVVMSKGSARCKTCLRTFPVGALTHGNGTYLGQCFECECKEEDA